MPPYEDETTEFRERLTADEYRKISREAIIEYLRDHTNIEERKDIFKSALNEWLEGKFAEFGWFSFKTLAAVVFFGALSMWLFTNGWIHK